MPLAMATSRLVVACWYRTSSRRCIQPGEKGVTLLLGKIVNHHLARQWTSAAQQLLDGKLKAVLVVGCRGSVDISSTTVRTKSADVTGPADGSLGVVPSNVVESRVPMAHGVEAVYWPHGLS